MECRSSFSLESVKISMATYGMIKVSELDPLKKKCEFCKINSFDEKTVLSAKKSSHKKTCPRAKKRSNSISEIRKKA